MILKTKLFIPPLRKGLVSRPRLTKLITEGTNTKMLFISAPAGFGKSTLMVEWASQSRMPVAWVSLDKTENNLISFLSHLLCSVQSIYPNLGNSILGVVQGSGSPPIGRLLNAWMNEIAEYTEEFVLILDDFHQIDSPDVIDLICNLIEHQPSQLHLLLASRADPPKCFSRLRAQGDMIDLDITDLRFTAHEAITYLRTQLGDKINTDDARQLNDRTEGWIAGLQMAALSMSSSNEISQFVREFSAQNRYITDYLLDEVLLHQPEQITNFLLATSILERFTAPLCDYVAGIQNSQEILEILEHSGLFVIPLDTTRTWYRYHHLFAELLRRRLEETRLFRIEVLHRRAFEWFASKRLLEECIRHAFALNDYELVIKQIEKSLNQIMAEGHFRNYLEWVDRIPKHYLKAKPRLEIVKIYMLQQVGQLDDRDKQLKFIDELLGPLPQDLSECSSGELINHGILAALKAIIFAGTYFLKAETERNVGLANRLLPEEYILWRAMAAVTIPFLNRALGDYDKAIEGFSEVLELDIRIGSVFQSFVACCALTKAYLESGRLKLATLTCRRFLEMDIKHGARLPFAKLAYLLMGELKYQAGELNEAYLNIEMGLEDVVCHGDMYTIIDGYSTLVRIRLASEGSEQALALIREMKEAVGELFPSENARKIMNAWEAYTMICSGDWEQAKKWAAEPGYDRLEGNYAFRLESHTYIGIYRVSQTPIQIYSDFIGMTKARLYLSLGQLPQALEIIDEVWEDCERGGRAKHRVEASIIRSMILKKMKRTSEAVGILKDAIHLAVREGFIQVFLNDGPELMDLLEEVKDVGFGDIEEQVFILGLLDKKQRQIPAERVPISNATGRLTAREIEVLECLGSGLSYFQVAEQLSISRNTLKTHTKRIYQKLGVNGLLQALNRAKDMRMLN